MCIYIYIFFLIYLFNYTDFIGETIYTWTNAVMLRCSPNCSPWVFMEPSDPILGQYHQLVKARRMSARVRKALLVNLPTLAIRNVDDRFFSKWENPMSRLFSWDIGSDIGAPDPELHSSECVRSCGVCCLTSGLSLSGVVTGRQRFWYRHLELDEPWHWTAENFSSLRCKISTGPRPIDRMQLTAPSRKPLIAPLTGRAGCKKITTVQRMDGPGLQEKAWASGIAQGVACIGQRHAGMEMIERIQPAEKNHFNFGHAPNVLQISKKVQPCASRDSTCIREV